MKYKNPNHLFLSISFLLMVSLLSACSIHTSISNLGNSTTTADSTPEKEITPSFPSPTSINLAYPTASPSNSTSPIVLIAGVENGDLVSVFSDSNCTQLVGSGTASGASIEIQLDPLSNGSYSLYTSRTQGSFMSPCSLFKLDYTMVGAGAPSKLRFSSEPINTSIYEPMNTMVKVEVLDQQNNLVTMSSADITLTIQNDPVGNSVVMGSTTAVAIFGVAYFPNVKIDEVGTGFTLSASSAGLTSAVSQSFNVTTGPKYVFRSTGSQTTYDTTTTPGVSLSISATTATFSSAFTFERIAVGDAITYDSNGASANAANQIVFITAVLGSGQFKVKTASGGVPVATSNDSDWAVNRAYSSVTNAESGAENSLIVAGLRDFDTWTGGRDLVANNEVWNIFCHYSINDSTMTVDGWTTSATQYLNFYVPRYTNETTYVYHYHFGDYSGTFSGFNEIGLSNTVLTLSDDFVRIDGFLIVDDIDGSDTSVLITSVGASSDIRILNNRFVASRYSVGGSGNKAIQINSGNVKIANSTFAGYEVGTNSTVISINTTGSAYLYANTLIGGQTGIDVVAGAVMAINNITAKIFNGFNGTLAVGSGRNSSSSTTDSTGSGSFQNSTPAFNFIGNLNDPLFSSFHLKYSNFALLRGGTNLYTNSNLAVRSDISLKPRSILPSIGAYESTPSIYRSMGFGSTAAIYSGAGTGDLTVFSNSKASFAFQALSSVSYGDILEYFDGTQLRLAVIYSFDFTNNTYGILTPGLDQATVTAAPTSNWRIYRAHTSLNKAFNRIENSSLDSLLVDMDSGHGGISLPSETRWIVIPTADQVHTENVHISDWSALTQDSLVLIPSEMTGAQANGTWSSSKFTLLGEVSTTSKVTFDRIQFEASGQSSAPTLNINNSASPIYRNVFRATGKNNVGDAIRLNTSVLGNEYVAFNIIYDYRNSNGSAAGIRGSSNSTSQLYFNTIYNADIGIVDDGLPLVQNNLVQGCSEALSGVLLLPSQYAGNVADQLSEFPGSSDLNSVQVKFIDPENKDFRLDTADYGARYVRTSYTTFGSPDGFGVLTEFNIGNAGADQGGLRIHRSMGFNKTTSVATAGGTTGLTISGSKATFSASLPNTVGIGDVLLFKLAGNGASDKAAVISRRFSATQFSLQNFDGTPFTNAKTGSDTSWSIYRAYTSLANLNSGAENTGIAVGLRSFDAHTGGKDLGSYKEQWHVSLYADATDTGAVTFGTWNSNNISDQFLRFFTPSTNFEVGTTQRHNGIPGATGYIRSMGATRSLDFYTSVQSVIVDGLQLQNSSLTWAAVSSPAVGGSIILQNSLIYDQGAGFNQSGLSIVGATYTKAINNVFLGHNVGVSTSNAGTVYLQNNFFESNACINISAFTNFTGINNAGICATTGMFVDPSGTSTAGSANNAFSDNSGVGSGSFHLTQTGSQLFTSYSNDGNYTNDEFKIKDTSSQLYRTGSVVNIDPISSFKKIRIVDDIFGLNRGSNWDIGPDQY